MFLASEMHALRSKLTRLNDVSNHGFLDYRIVNVVCSTDSSATRELLKADFAHWKANLTMPPRQIPTLHTLIHHFVNMS